MAPYPVDSGVCPWINPKLTTSGRQLNVDHIFALNIFIIIIIIIIIKYWGKSSICSIGIFIFCKRI